MLEYKSQRKWIQKPRKMDKLSWQKHDEEWATAYVDYGGRKNKYRVLDFKNIRRYAMKSSR